MPYETLQELKTQHGKVKSNLEHPTHEFQKTLDGETILDLLYMHETLSRELLIRIVEDAKDRDELSSEDERYLIEHVSEATMLMYRLYNLGYFTKN